MEVRTRRHVTAITIAALAALLVMLAAPTAFAAPPTFNLNGDAYQHDGSTVYGDWVGNNWYGEVEAILRTRYPAE